MVELFCWFVGGRSGSVFSVDIDTNETVADLKKAIKARDPYHFKCVDVYKLQLFLAKTMDNKWLSSCSKDVSKLMMGKKTLLIEALIEEGKKLQAADLLEDVLDGMDPPSFSQIHVLVVVQEYAMSKLGVLFPRFTVLKEAEKYAEECISLLDWDVPAVHKIPLIWKFMSNLGGCTKTGEIFWRMEERQLVSLVVDEWFRESSPDYVNRLAKKKSIMIGPPGTGKSTLLCMMAFYLVFKHKKNVLVYRQFANQENCLFYLGYEKGKVVQFTAQICKVPDAYNIYDELIRQQDTRKVWLFLDGFHLRNVPEGMKRYKMLATLTNVGLRGSEVEYTYSCLLPCWSKKDLLSIGGFIYNFSPEDMEKRYHYSGGSVREFTLATLEDIRVAIDRAIGCVDDVSKLLSNRSWKVHHNLLCHAFVKQMDRASSFMKVQCWEHVIDSEYASRVLSQRLRSEELSNICK